MREMAKFQKITPFLWFDGNAEEAVKFYTSVFGNSKTGKVLRNGDNGPGPKENVLVIEFELEGQRFTALNGGPMYKFTPAVSFFVLCDDQKEVDRLWSLLTADGGKEVQCGGLEDKFGLSWQIVPKVLMEMMGDKDQAKAGRAMAAMMQMVKFDIKKLQTAFEGR
jgi:predicted 3-demethylubiquinone-9 3-methyltransferase (glyoxalase superfamily)